MTLHPFLLFFFFFLLHVSYVSWYDGSVLVQWGGVVVGGGIVLVRIGLYARLCFVQFSKKQNNKDTALKKKNSQCLYWRGLTKLFRRKDAWLSGIVPLDWQIRVVVPVSKRGDQRLCCSYHTTQPPWKVYFMSLERKLQPKVEFWIQENQCRFRPGRRRTD